MDKIGMIEKAKKLVRMRKVGYYPGWSFGIADSFNDRKTIERKNIWNHFHSVKRHTELLVRWDRNIQLGLSLGDDISWCLFVGGCIDPNEFCFINTFLKKGMVVADVGANCGIYSLFSAKRVGKIGKVIAIEPSSREVKRLERNINLNIYKNIQILPVALSDHKTRKTLHVASDVHNGQNTLGQFVHPGVEKSRDEIVQLNTLDNIFGKQGLRRLDFLKIDVEGSEYKALVGGKDVINKYKPTILIEVSSQSLENQKSSARQVIKYLKRLKYNLYFFCNQTGKPTKFLRTTGVESLSLNILATH